MIKIIELDFYMKENGNIPVQDFLYSLNPKLRAKAFRDIELLKKLGVELKEPYVKPIKGKDNKDLYELRIKFSSDIARYFTLYIITISLCCCMDLLKRLGRHLKMK